jgi:hypothetical protein
MHGIARARGRLTPTVIAALLALVLVVPATLATSGAQAPSPFGKYLVYTAAGVFDSSVLPAEGDLADWFHRQIMGRDDAELAAEEARADAYFTQAFGSLYRPGSLTAFGLDPRNEYRAYFVSGEKVPPDGWVVRDGGFQATLSDGGLVVFGDYNIAATKNKKPAEPILIHYESTDPIYAQDDGSLLFRCRLTSESFDDFGGGLAQGMSDAQELADGRTVANIRNILTFPGYGFDATP